MTSSTSAATVRAVPERFGWTLRVLLVLGVLYLVLTVVTLAGQAVQLADWVQPGARVPISVGTAYVLPTRAGTNEYAGTPFVRDGTDVVATRVATVLNDVPLGSRIALGVAPILWTVTALVVTLCLVVALRRLAAGSPFGRDAAQPVVIAAIALAAGGSLAQLVQGASSIAFGGFAWAAPLSTGHGITRTDGFTFEFTPLVAACGLLAVALILRRGLALQRRLDGPG